jgi:Holliday junction resolvase RusA-like endonuclease
LDSLAHAKVFPDDCDIDDLRITRFAVRPGGQLAVQISEIAGEATDSGELFQSEWEVA